MTEEITVSREGQTFGPYTLEEVREYLASGHIAMTDLAWQAGMEEWQPLNAFPQFNDRRSPPPPPVVQKKKGFCMFAIGSLAAFLSFWVGLGLYAGFGAVVLGHLARRQLKSEPGLRGRRLALTGLIGGYCIVGLWGFLRISDGIVDRAAEGRTRAEVAAMRQALENYRAQFGTYPVGVNESEDGDNSFLRRALCDGEKGIIFLEAPHKMIKDGNLVDPNGRSYGYRFPGTTSGPEHYDLWSVPRPYLPK